MLSLIAALATAAALPVAVLAWSAVMPYHGTGSAARRAPDVPRRTTAGNWLIAERPITARRAPGR